jgi:hypothetical protein
MRQAFGQRVQLAAAGQDAEALDRSAWLAM